MFIVEPLSKLELAGDTHRQVLVTLNEARIHPLGLAEHFYVIEALKDFFPDYLQLQLSKPDPHATVDTEAERQMLARPGAVDDEVVRAFDHFLIAVPRNVPHHHLIALSDPLAADFDIFKRG